MIPRPLAYVILSVVTFVWAITITAPLWRPEYAPHPAIHAVFTVIVGGSMSLTRGASGTVSRILGAMRTPTDPPAPPPVESESGS